MYNKLIMIGNLTRDIQMKHLPSGTAIAKSAIATTHKYKTPSGEKKEEVCFLDFTLFGRSAEIANQYLKKGSKVMLDGKLVLEKWVGQDGKNKSKHSLNVDTMQMLGKDKSIEPSEKQTTQQKSTAPVDVDIDDEEIPF